MPLRLIVVVSAVFLLTACQQQNTRYEATDHSIHSSHLTTKTGYIDQAKNSYKLETSPYSFITINEWYDENTILYLSDENGRSKLLKFNLLNGVTESFYERDEPITNVEASPDYSYFYIEVASFQGQKEIVFVDKDGFTIFSIADLGEEFQLYWNEYEQGQLMLASVDTNYNLKLNLINVNKKEMVDFDFDYYHLQWINEKEFVYLKWDTYAPGFHAPLHMYNTITKEDKMLVDNTVAYFTFSKYLLTITVDHKSSNYSTYRFYDLEDLTIVSQFNTPILNTYSDQWWLPSFAFDHSKGIYYYLAPNQDGDLFDYDGGFTLTAMDIIRGESKDILSLNESFPIKISPQGKFLLYGNQLEYLVNLENGEEIKLLNW